MIPFVTQAELDAERSVIGAILLWPENLPRVDLSPHQFAEVRWAATWSAIRELEAAQTPIDLISVGHRLEQGGKLMTADLGKAAFDVLTAANLEHYVEMVRGAWVRRQVALACSAAVEQAKQHDAGEDLVSSLLQRVAEIHTERPGGEEAIRPMVRARLREILDAVDAKAKGDPYSTGVLTGIPQLDAVLGGLQRGVVTVMAGRPGMGKSAAALSVTRHAANAGVGVHVFSLEDTRDAYLDRVISGASGVAATDIRTLDLDAARLGRMNWALAGAFERELPWLVEDRTGITADEVVRSVRRRLRDNGTQLVVVDYVQLLKPPRGTRAGEEAVTHSMNVLADAAKQDGICYLVLAQLNRDCEKRDNKRPQLSDLKQAGTIEERAKCVAFLYRPAMYSERDERGEAIGEDVIEVIVAKNNQGRTGTAFAQWDGATARVF